MSSVADAESKSEQAFCVRDLPPWLISMIVHLSVLILFGLLHFEIERSNGSQAVNISWDAGGAGELDIGTSDGGQLGEALIPGEAPVDQKLDDQLATSAIELNELVATGTPLNVGPLLDFSVLDAVSDGEATGKSTKPAARGGRGQSVGDGDGSQPGRASMFGLEGFGRKFVYVFDRSDSMNYRYYSQENTAVYSIPLQAAKDELMASLNDLGPKQQFHIVFYNHQPQLYDSGRSPRRKSYATPQNKGRAMEDIYSLRADGGTNTVTALEIALQLDPDVIFLLTDGEAKDDPTIRDLQRLESMNRKRALINVIQFAQEDRPESTLVKLAEQNRGKHVFINITRAGEYARQVGAQLRREIGEQLKKPKSRN